MAAGRWDDGSWRHDAACRLFDPDLFFPVGAVGPPEQQKRQAKSVCFKCPVRSECLRFAVATNQQFGIWGGLDEDERRSFRRRTRANGVLDDFFAGSQF